jgi:hypothetical protein
MENALHPPNPGKAVAIALAAALLGAGVATTAHALTDSDKASPSRVVFVESSGDDSTAGPTPMSGARP